MSWPCKVPGLPQARCCTPSWILFIGVLVSTYAQIINIFSYFTHIIMVLFVPVNGLAPRGPSHPHTLSSSPAFVLSRLQYTQYFDIHFSSCFLYLNMNFTVSVDVLAQQVSGWSPNWILFLRRSQHSICTLMSTIICVSCIWIWFSPCLWMSWPRRCQAIHRLRSDHLTEYCLSKISISTDSLKNIIVSISYIWN